MTESEHIDTMSYFIVAITNGGGTPEQACQKLHEVISFPGKDFSEMFKFEVPSLMVGTLDSLMTLSDGMDKTDTIVESIVRNIEKTGMELSAYAGKTSELTVGGVPAQRYIQQFAWDYAKYPNRRPLKEIAYLISGGVSAIDEELKQLLASFADKQAALAAAKQRRSGNLLVADLNDVLTPDIMRCVDINDTEYLKTLFIALPKGSEELFLSCIDTLASDLVGYGGPDWSRFPDQLGTSVKFGTFVDRERKRGSPVVPGSVRLVKEDTESSLFTVTILKSQYEAGHYEKDEFIPGKNIDFEVEFIKKCHEKRFIVRQFKYDPSQSSNSAMLLEQLQVEVDAMRSGLTRWCKTHYGEVFVAWMHIKVIRVFAESVLRYGLPVDFTAVLYKVTDDNEEEMINALDKALGSLQIDEEEDGEEYHDFVFMKFQV